MKNYISSIIQKFIETFLLKNLGENDNLKKSFDMKPTKQEKEMRSFKNKFHGYNLIWFESLVKPKQENPKDNNNQSNNDDDDDVDVDDDDVDVDDDDVSNDDKVTTTTTTTKTEKSNPFDFFKSLGGILKESKELKKQEDLQRIKNLLK